MKKRIIILFVLIGFMALMGQNAIAGDYKEVKINALCSTSKEIMSKLRSLLSAGDKVAAQKLIMTGMIKTIPKGTMVEIEDTAIFSGLIKIRPKGEVQSYWTVTGAVYGD